MNTTLNRWYRAMLPSTALVATLGATLPAQGATEDDRPADASIRETYRRPEGRPLAVGGFSTLAVAYAGSVAAGSVARWAMPMDMGPLTQREDLRLRTYGGHMLIPVVGPFIAAPQANAGAGRALTITAGLSQSLGLSLAIAGLVRARRGHPVRRWSVHPLADRTRVGMGVSVRFR